MYSNIEQAGKCVCQASSRPRLVDDPAKALEYGVPGIGDVGDGIPRHRQELPHQNKHLHSDSREKN